MHDETRAIFNFLPINKNTIEEEYTDHLWKALVSLDSGEPEGTPFLIMPFHLLFMLSIQYKILRIYKQNKTKYHSAFLLHPPRDNEKDLLNPTSVFTLGLLEESKLINLLKIIKVKDNVINPIKSLIRNRNDNLAHAKGGIERNLDQKIEDYLNVLMNIQPYFEKLNDKITERWLKNMGSGQDGVDYIETHLAEEYLCPADMWTGKLAKLEDKLNNKQSSIE